MKFHCSIFKSYDELIASFDDPMQVWYEFGGEVVQFKGDHVIYRLMITFNEGNFSFCYSHADPNSYMDTLTLVSVTDPTLIREFVIVDDNNVPAGSFVDRDTARRVVEAFCAAPTSPPELIKWADETSLPWPQI